jgi:hypothetical protein
MSTPNPRDTHNHNSLLYYAPRRLRDRAQALRAIQPRPKESGELGPTVSLEQGRGYDAALSENNFSEALRPVSEPEPMEPNAFVHQRARRNGAFVVAICSAAVAGIAGGAVLLYVMNFNGPRDQSLSAKDSSTSLSATPQEKRRTWIS